MHRWTVCAVLPPTIMTNSYYTTVHISLAHVTHNYRHRGSTCTFLVHTRDTYILSLCIIFRVFIHFCNCLNRLLHALLLFTCVCARMRVLLHIYIRCTGFVSVSFTIAMSKSFLNEYWVFFFVHFFTWSFTEVHHNFVTLHTFYERF